MLAYLDLQKEIEEKVLRRRRFVKSRMLQFGFAEENDACMLTRDFLDSDFTAHISVGSGGRLSARVIDNMNGEEYVQLRSPAFNGSYVNTVRSAYGEMLEDIALHCCEEAGFDAEQSNRIAERIRDEFGVSPDFPWEKDGADTYGVFRHRDTGKWFALVMDIQKGKLDGTSDKTRKDIMNLKADESQAAGLQSEEGIYPAWHMNHKKWISVMLDDTLSDDRVMELVEDSFRLTDRMPGGLSEALIHEVLSIADSVPPGNVVSYGQIAEMAGRKKNARLVGKIMSMADRYGEHPCHRVVNSAGRTVPGWDEQRSMLEAEGVGFRENGCVDMAKYRWQPDENKTGSGRNLK